MILLYEISIQITQDIFKRHSMPAAYILEEIFIMIGKKTERHQQSMIRNSQRYDDGKKGGRLNYYKKEGTKTWLDQKFGPHFGLVPCFNKTAAILL